MTNTTKSQRKDSIWITDFRSAIQEQSQAVIVPYRLNGQDGYMLRWNGTEAPILSLPSPVKGWHEIHVGFWGASGCRIRLSNEPFFRWLASNVRWDRGPNDGEEALWKIADLTGLAFEFLPFPMEMRCDQRESQIAYLRLVPISAAQGQQQMADLNNRPTRTAGAAFDGHVLGWYLPQSPEECGAILEPFIDSDFKRIYYGCTITTHRVNYLSKVGYYLGQGQSPDSLHTDSNRRCAQALQTAERKGYDPLRILIDYAASHSLELWANFRIQQDYAKDYCNGIGEDFVSPLADAHPEWRLVDRHGKVWSHKFSHFHPGWEQYKLDLLAEMAEYGPAGLRLDLTSMAKDIWDFTPSAVQAFKQKYGMDPTATDQPPVEWHQFCCDHFTAFLRRLRAQTNRIGERLKRQIPIAVQVTADREILSHPTSDSLAVAANFLYGYDIASWAREGLVDIISPSFRSEYRPMFLEHIYEELGEHRKRVRLIPCVGQYHRAVFPAGYDWSIYAGAVGIGKRSKLKPLGELDAWRILREAHDLYQLGADAVDVWEMGEVTHHLPRWNILKHIGDRKMLRREFGARIGPMMGFVDHPVTFKSMAST